MVEPLRLRPGRRSGRTQAADPARGGRGAGGSSEAQTEQATVRRAPWLAFNATALPAPLGDASPGFGPNRFLLGANLPWIRYGLDFGSSPATPAGGLHADADAAALLEVAMARLRRDSVESARVFLFCDARAGIRFAEDGTPEGLDGAVFADVDMLLATAERHRIGLHLVLFDAGLVATPCVQDGVRCGGHADVLAEPAKCEALLERVVEPLLRRYGSHPAIDCWDLFDEPECATAGMECPRPARARSARRWNQVAGALSAGLRALGLEGSGPPAAPRVEASAMRSFLGAAVQAVHQHTRGLATVGLASTANLSLVQGLGLDFYQAHWWEPYGDAALRRAAADFRLDRPLVLGAFPASTATKSVKTVLDTARCAGYGGALVWSLRAVDARGGEEGQLSQFVRNHQGHLYRRPLRVEAAAEASPLRPAEPFKAAPEAATLVGVPSAADSVDEDESERPRGEGDARAPGLAAAPA